MRIGYAPLSTARQGESLEAQCEALAAAGCPPEHIYTDVISGMRWRRRGLETALAYMRPGDVLVVTRLDRLGRNLREAVNTIADLGERDMNVQCLSPDLDTSRAQDRVVINVMLSLASWERDLLVERTKEGVAHARAEGRVAGPKPKLSAEQVRLARKAIAGGESVAAVARSLAVSRQTLYRALERQA